MSTATALAKRSLRDQGDGEASSTACRSERVSCATTGLRYMHRDRTLQEKHRWSPQPFKEIGFQLSSSIHRAVSAIELL